MMTIREIIGATDGKLVAGTEKGRINGVSTDTRHIRKNQLFVAIRGENYDAHDFLDKAAAGGARALLVSALPRMPLPSGVTVIQVADTVKALGFLARHYRRKFKIPVIAITGSAGKTTTKELIASVLKTQYRVLYNKGTENNHIGVPMTLLKLKSSHEAAVIETGTNHHGEINWLGSVVEPTVAVFTNIGASHLEGLGTPVGVFREKATLVRHVARQGALVVNADDRLLARLVKKQPVRVISYAIDHAADVRAQGVEIRRQKITFRVGRETVALAAPVWGNVYNALAAIVCGRFLKVKAENIRRGIARFKAPKGRQVFLRVKGVTVIDDTYNANPVSFRNAVSTLKVMKTRGRAILVGADMLELGDKSQALHDEVGIFAARAGVDVLLTCGARAARISRAARATVSSMDARHMESQEALLEALKALIKPGDVVLVKGSRGMRMENVVHGLVNHLKG